MIHEPPGDPNGPIWQLIAARLLERSHGKIGNCTVCRTNTWTIGGQYIALSGSDHPTQPTIAPRTYPLVPLSCNTCGNTLLINLLFLFDESELNQLRLLPAWQRRT